MRAAISSGDTAFPRSLFDRWRGIDGLANSPPSLVTLERSISTAQNGRELRLKNPLDNRKRRGRTSTMRAAAWARLVALVAGLGVACASTTKFTVNVDALRDASAPDKTRYVLVPAMENVPESDLQFKEFSAYLRKALLSRGFQEAASPQEAEVAVLVAYGIGEPRSTSYTYSIPIFGQTGGGTAMYSGSTYGPGGYSTSYGTIHQPALYSVVGVSSGTTTVTTYFRFCLSLCLSHQSVVGKRLTLHRAA